MIEIMKQLASNPEMRKCISTVKVVEKKDEPIYEYRTVKKKAS